MGSEERAEPGALFLSHLEQTAKDAEGIISFSQALRYQQAKLKEKLKLKGTGPSGALSVFQMVTEVETRRV